MQLFSEGFNLKMMFKVVDDLLKYTATLPLSNA